MQLQPSGRSSSALVAPGGAVFKGRQVQLTRLVDLEERGSVRPSLTVVQACTSG
ncbi:MAG TPA: hypothetical protein VF469_09735 [Kofleriaceae bacterium]